MKKKKSYKKESICKYVNTEKNFMLSNYIFFTFY